MIIPLSSFPGRFETDYYLASMQKPYIAVMDGYTSQLYFHSDCVLATEHGLLPQWEED